MIKMVVGTICRLFLIQKIFIKTALCPCIIPNAMVNAEMSELYFYSSKIIVLLGK